MNLINAIPYVELRCSKVQIQIKLPWESSSLCFWTSRLNRICNITSYKMMKSPFFCCFFFFFKPKRLKLMCKWNKIHTAFKSQRWSRTCLISRRSSFKFCSSEWFGAEHTQWANVVTSVCLALIEITKEKWHRVYGGHEPAHSSGCCRQVWPLWVL